MRWPVAFLTLDRALVLVIPERPRQRVGRGPLLDRRAGFVEGGRAERTLGQLIVRGAAPRARLRLARCAVADRVEAEAVIRIREGVRIEGAVDLIVRGHVRIVGFGEAVECVVAEAVPTMLGLDPGDVADLAAGVAVVHPRLGAGAPYPDLLRPHQRIEGLGPHRTARIGDPLGRDPAEVAEGHHPRTRQPDLAQRAVTGVRIADHAAIRRGVARRLAVRVIRVPMHDLEATIFHGLALLLALRIVSVDGTRGAVVIASQQPPAVIAEGDRLRRRL